MKAIATVFVAGMVLAACAGAASESRTIQLPAMNDSGVVGSLTLVDVGQNRTNVIVDVAANGNLDMPAHIHPGTCDDLVPQPRYPLRNVANGHSDTVVPASLPELLAGDLAVNLHRSNDDLATYTACANLR